MEQLPEIPQKTREIIDSLMLEALDDSAGKDFEFARANLRVLIEKGNLSVDNLYVLAERSQHPAAYAVLAKVIDTLVSANEKLLGLQEKIRAIKDVSIRISEVNLGKTVNQTAIFVGSTADLQRTLKRRNMNIIEDKDDSNS